MGISKAGIAREYRVKYGMDMPTRKLSRIMYSENNLTFKNIDDARTVIQKIEGKAGGKSHKASSKNTQFYKPEHRPENPYELPKSDETIYEPYIIKAAGF